MVIGIAMVEPKMLISPPMYPLDPVGIDLYERYEQKKVKDAAEKKTEEEQVQPEETVNSDTTEMISS